MYSLNNTACTVSRRSPVGSHCTRPHDKIIMRADKRCSVSGVRDNASGSGVSSVSSSLSVVASPFCVPEIGGVWTMS
jgi:hypothetical protein